MYRGPEALLPAGPDDPALCHADSYCDHVYHVSLKGQISAHDFPVCGN